MNDDMCRYRRNTDDIETSEIQHNEIKWMKIKTNQSSCWFNEQKNTIRIKQINMLVPTNQWKQPRLSNLIIFTWINNINDNVVCRFVKGHTQFKVPNIFEFGVSGKKIQFLRFGVKKFDFRGLGWGTRKFIWRVGSSCWGLVVSDFDTKIKIHFSPWKIHTSKCMTPWKRPIWTTMHTTLSLIWIN